MTATPTAVDETIARLRAQQRDLGKIGSALLNAVSLLDGLASLMAIPYRPARFQPIYDGWQESNATYSTLGTAADLLDWQQRRIADLEAGLNSGNEAAR